MWLIEESALGRIVVPPSLPVGFAVFSTTRDYPGRIVASELTDFLFDRFGIDASLTTCRQIHSATVVRAHHSGSWRECDSCDALISDEKHVALAIKVADCLPVSLIDPAHGVIANIHSGWRGAAAGITAKTLDLLDAASTSAYLGPSIRACCFEVGEEVATLFDPRFVDRTSYAKPHVDLIALTTDVLRSRGITQISDSGLCTRCEDSIFHSYRRHGAGSGRNLVLTAQ